MARGNGSVDRRNDFSPRRTDVEPMLINREWPQETSYSASRSIVEVQQSTTILCGSSYQFVHVLYTRHGTRVQLGIAQAPKIVLIVVVVAGAPDPGCLGRPPSDLLSTFFMNIVMGRFPCFICSCRLAGGAIVAILLPRIAP